MRKFLVLRPTRQELGDKFVFRRELEEVSFDEKEKKSDQLAFLQKQVGGLIELLRPSEILRYANPEEFNKTVDSNLFNNIDCFINEEGKFIDTCYPALRLSYDIIMGPMIFCGYDGKDGNIGLTEEQIENIKDVFGHLPMLYMLKKDQ